MHANNLNSTLFNSKLGNNWIQLFLQWFYDIQGNQTRSLHHMSMTEIWQILLCRSTDCHFASRSTQVKPPIMMTSSNGNIFRVTGLLCGEFTGHRWIPRTKSSDAELWCFLWSVPEPQLSKQWRRRWLETPSRSLWLHCNVLQFISNWRAFFMLLLHSLNKGLWTNKLKHTSSPTSSDDIQNTYREPIAKASHYDYTYM